MLQAHAATWQRIVKVAVADRLIINPEKLRHRGRKVMRPGQPCALWNLRAADQPPCQSCPSLLPPTADNLAL
eukprot:scaffold190756_cov33-Tisochrysis_lutea.AAC.1